MIWGSSVSVFRQVLQVVAALSTASLSLPAAAQAPTQTREGAIRFLGLYASQNQPPIVLSTSFDRLEVDARLRMPVPSVKWTEVSPVNPERPCRLQFKKSDGQITQINWEKSKVFFHSRANWSEAMLASAYGPMIKPMIEIRRGSISDVIWPASEEEGARLFRAMHFIVQSCDPTAATGF